MQGGKGLQVPSHQSQGSAEGSRSAYYQALSGHNFELATVFLLLATVNFLFATVNPLLATVIFLLATVFFVSATIIYINAAVLGLAISSGVAIYINAAIFAGC